MYHIYPKDESLSTRSALRTIRTLSLLTRYVQNSGGRDNNRKGT